MDKFLRWLALPFLRRLRDEAFLSDYQCELLGVAAEPEEPKPSKLRAARLSAPPSPVEETSTP